VTRETGEEGPLANREVQNKEITGGMPDEIAMQGDGEGTEVSGQDAFNRGSIEDSGKLPEQGIVASPKSVPGIEGDIKGIRTSGSADGPKPGRPVTIEVAPGDPSGVTKIVTDHTGAKEVTYATGKTINYEPGGQEVEGPVQGQQDRMNLMAKETFRASAAEAMKKLQPEDRAELERLMKMQEVGGEQTSGVGTFGIGATLQTEAGRERIRERARELMRKVGIDPQQTDRRDFEQRLAGGSGDATVNTPPASVAPQPTKAPPRPRQLDRDGNPIPLPGELQLNQSYNPVSKYGVNLFEAKRKFK